MRLRGGFLGWGAGRLVGVLLLAAVGVLLGMAGGVASASAAPEHAYVTNVFSDSVTPIDLETNEAETAIGAGYDPDAIAITPNGKYAYVTNEDGNLVTPIDLETSEAETAIEVGAQPDAIAITPNGKYAYVTNEGISDSVTPIDLETNTPETAIGVGLGPDAIAITPNGKYAYVTNAGSESVTPIDLETNTPETAIGVGLGPDAIAITPNGKYAYVTNHVSDSVTPIDLETNTPETNIGAGQEPQGIAITPNGKYAYVTNRMAGNSSFVTPIDLETSETETRIKVGADPVGIAIAPVVEPGFTIAKQQRLEGEASYTTAELQDSTETTVEYEVVVKNTGNLYLNFSKLSDAGCEDISPGGEVELAPGGEQSYTCKRQHFPHAGKWANTASITGNEGTGEETSNTVTVNVEPAAPACSMVHGVGHVVPKGKGGQNLRVNLNTTSGGTFTTTTPNREATFALTHLTSASCVATAGGYEFSGTGTARMHKVKGYEMVFSFSTEGGKTYLSLEVSKEGTPMYEITHEPLTKGSKVKIS
jgi:YVTN family beta-propeller protein